MRPMSMRAAVGLVAALSVASITLPQRAQAQSADELGSPVAPGTEVRRPDGTVGTTPAAPPSVTPAAPGEATPPSSYDSLPVPPAPGSDEGIRYPGVEPRQRPMLTTDAGLRIPSGIATRLRALDSDFQILALRGNSVVGGIISMLAGGLAIALGIVNDVGSSTGFGSGMSPYLYVYGGSGVLRGALELALMTDASGPAITFAHMPMTSTQEVQQRLEYGERELANLAERAMISRILDGSLSIAVGLAIVPIYLGPEGFEDFESNPLAWIGIATAAISVISGVITLVTNTEAERRWGAYQELRDRLAARGDAERGERDRVTSRAGTPVDDDEEEDGDGADELSRRSAPTILPTLAGGAGSGTLGVAGTF